MDLNDDRSESVSTACGERPQRRMENFGVSALSDTELIAMVLQGNGTRAEQAVTVAGRLIAEAGSVVGLAAWQAADYRRLKGIGDSPDLHAVALEVVLKSMQKILGLPSFIDHCQRFGLGHTTKTGTPIRVPIPYLLPPSTSAVKVASVGKVSGSLRSGKTLTLKTCRPGRAIAPGFMSTPN